MMVDHAQDAEVPFRVDPAVRMAQRAEGMRSRIRLERAGLAGSRLGPVAALLLILLTACSVRAVDPLGIQAAVEATRLAVDAMAGALLGLPPATRDEVAAEVRLTAEAAHRTLDRIGMRPAPVVDAGLAHELAFVEDLARATAAELQHAAASAGSGPSGAALLGRLEPLLSATRVRLDLADGLLDRWIERTHGALVEVESSHGMLVVRSTDRMIHGAIRYAGLGLLLLGVLMIGLRLLRISEERSGPLVNFADQRGISTVAILALGAFFVASLTFTFSPGTLAALSAEVERQPPEHPCLMLDRQREHLAAAKAIGHAGLIDAAKQRMVEPARDCLGLSSQPAATAAVTRLATRTGADPSSAGLGPAGTQAGTLPASATLGPAGEPAGDASSAAIRDDGPPKPVLRATLPRERVTTARVNYRSAPRPDANRLGTLAPGTRVTVLADANGWTEVRLREGKKAFVASRFLQPTP
jgi:hypothetical protein